MRRTPHARLALLILLVILAACGAPTPLAVPAMEPPEIRVAVESCEVRVRIGGVQQWIEKPAEFCGISPVPSPSASPSTSPSASPSPLPSPAPSPSPSLSPSPSPSPAPSPSPSASPGGGPIVGSGGYATISAAIAAATPGQTIRIRAGTYPEAVVVTKTLSLIPFGDGPPVVTGSCARANGIRITAHDVLVRGLTVENTRDAAILIDGQGSVAPARATIDGNTIRDFDCQRTGPEYRAGVGAWYAGPGHTVTNNVIDRVANVAAGSNPNNAGNGVWFKSNSANPSGGGHLIANNTITDVYDGIGGEVEDDPHGGFDRDTTIRQNTITGCRDDGISVEGGTQNVRVTDNVISRCALGLANAPNLTGPVYFERNRITEGVPGQYNNVQCFKIGDGGSGVAYYTGNTCVLTAAGATGWGQTNAGVTSIIARNNIINVTRYVVELNSPAAGATFSFDGDCLWSTDPTRFVEMPNGRWLTIAAWSAATGQEATGVQSASCGVSGNVPPTPAFGNDADVRHADPEVARDLFEGFPGSAASPNLAHVFLTQGGVPVRLTPCRFVWSEAVAPSLGVHITDVVRLRA